MSIAIDLPPETEERLSALAREHGLTLPLYVTHVLVEKVSTPAPPSASLRAQMWRDAAKGLPDTVPLSDEAVSRESIYGSCG